MLMLFGLGGGMITFGLSKFDWKFLKPKIDRVQLLSSDPTCGSSFVQNKVSCASCYTGCHKTCVQLTMFIIISHAYMQSNTICKNLNHSWSNLMSSKWNFTILDAISWAQNGTLPISLIAKIQIILELKMKFYPLAYIARPKEKVT
jgi:hypothetical protein